MKKIISKKTKNFNLWVMSSTGTAIVPALIFVVLMVLVFGSGRLVNTHFGLYIIDNPIARGIQDFFVGSVTVYILEYGALSLQILFTILLNICHSRKRN